MINSKLLRSMLLQLWIPKANKAHLNITQFIFSVYQRINSNTQHFWKVNCESLREFHCLLKSQEPQQSCLNVSKNIKHMLKSIKVKWFLQLMNLCLINLEELQISQLTLCLVRWDVNFKINKENLLSNFM